MIKRAVFTCLAFSFCIQGSLLSHCQMPCGIYHDDMVFDQIDQYIETMAKGISVLNDSKFSSVKDKNEFIRWVVLKEDSSDDVARIITEFFLQQKIKPGEDDTVKRLVSAQKLLFLLVAIKQTADLKYLNDFYEEWEKFKLMFHIEGYACKLEQTKLKKWKEQQKVMNEQEQQGQGADQTKKVTASGSASAENAVDHEHDDDEHDHEHGEHTHTH